MPIYIWIPPLQDSAAPLHLALGLDQPVRPPATVPFSTLGLLSAGPGCPCLNVASTCGSLERQRSPIRPGPALGRLQGGKRRRPRTRTWTFGSGAHTTERASSSIDRGGAPSSVAKHAPDPIPALLIGRLAVDRSHARLGVGTVLVAHVLATAVDLNDRAACRAVVVSALDAAARSWWERLGFHSFDPADHDNFDLYLLTREIEATLRSLG